MKVIEVEHLEKVFKIPHEKRNTIFSSMTGLFHPNNYEIFHALNDIHFSIDDGETFGIIGKNGSGKSTLLKLIAHVLTPTSGKITVRKNVTPFLELGVGFYWEFSVLENIRLYGTIMGLTYREIDDKTEEIITFAGLEKFRDTRLRHLSTGMQLRLAFSTAIQTRPEILLLDEVLAVGDLEFQKKCFDAFKKFKNEGVTILLASHDLSSIQRFCDRTLLIHQGNQIGVGETKDIISHYEKM